VTGRTAWSTAWDGRNTAGTLVADGTYRFSVTAKDAGGNRSVASATVVVDRTAGLLRWSRDFYAQDGDALLPTGAIGFRLTRSATVTLRILDAQGGLVRSVWTKRALTAGAKAWTWNGRDAAGAYVPQGRYVAELTATSKLGTTRLTRSVWAAAFAITPSATTVTAGKVLTVRFATIEPLATRPVVTFTQPGVAPASVTATRLADGTYRASFTVRAGVAGAATLRVRATDTGRHVNSTSIAIAVAP
jgi:hypothetical protein